MINGMKAAIFDMDGTLIDSMGEWRKRNVAFVREQGVQLSAEEEKTLHGMSGVMVAEYLKKQRGIDLDFVRLTEGAGAGMEPVYRRGVPVKPGAVEYLKRLRARGVKCVVATATPARLALIALNKMHLVEHLDYIFSTDMIGGTKAETEFYDRLCAMIGERKEDCVMFEDGYYAMQGASAAGLGVVGITDATNLRDRKGIHAVCDIVIDSYDELE